MSGEEPRPQYDYEIRVRGHLGTRMRRAFPALRARPQGEDTLLTGRLPDQAAVYGVIARLEALGLDLLELRRLRRHDQSQNQIDVAGGRATRPEL